jgi:hypothetical protein
MGRFFLGQLFGFYMLSLILVALPWTVFAVSSTCACIPARPV